jgi:diguanylate cyclase (GGDEF)-like protein
MGGDEFLVVLPETDEPGGEAFAARLAQGFDAEMRAMQSWKEMAVALGLSIGTAATGDSVAQVGQLLTAADEALYEAKRAAKNRASLAATR